MTDKADQRTWQAQADDDYLHNVVDEVHRLGSANEEHPRLLAGRPHSQRRPDGAASWFARPISVTRLTASSACRAAGSGSPDGYVRTGAAQGAPGGGTCRAGAEQAQRPEPPPAPARARLAAPAAAPLPPLDCDFNLVHLFARGANWRAASRNLPITSTWAQKYGCGDRVRDARM